MLLDLVVTTFRRPALLADTVASVLAAHRPAHLHVRVLIINNDPGTELSILDGLIAAAPFPILILVAPRRGKSHALNLAIETSRADFLGFIDDDERLGPEWFRVAQDALASGHLDFIGGPVRALWSSPPPSWIPQGYPAVLGTVDSGPSRASFSAAFPGMLVGGNAVIRRTLFDSIGRFPTDLGPQLRHRVMSCEDEEIYLRLLHAGARGEYLPDLIVYHHIHANRVSPAYFRQWSFWNAASKAVLHRRWPPAVPTVLGIPRYMYRRALRSAGAWLGAWVMNRGPAARLQKELPLIQLAGHLYGRFCLRPTDGRSTFTRQPIAGQVARRP